MTPTTALDALADLRGLELVDLSHPLHDAMPFFPGKGVLPFERRQTARFAEQGVGSGRFSMSEHQGTHLDAPCHFTDDPTAITDIPAVRLVSEAVVIRLHDQVAADPEHRLTVEDVEAWESCHGVVPRDAWVLLDTGWAARWADPATYLDQDVEGRVRHPACTPEAASLLVARGVRGVGIDTLSVDNSAPSAIRSPSHKVLHGAGALVLENLANLDRLPARGILLVIGAIPIVGGTGAPARVLAWIDRNAGERAPRP